MESGEKLQLLVLLACLQILTCSCSSITFQDNINNWEILIGANAKEFQYDFCHFDASQYSERCKNKPSLLATDMTAKCNCSVNYIAKADSAYFTVSCNNTKLDAMTVGCPQKLTITYEQGDP
ncbi:uncharacterized protein LOC135936174 [Cloeon dipterum]|uniref:uncharacterized protein LOC135936174 n=1 Tax=Cloeon dipterum TaxID=197152 RepID=UPI0032204E87